MLPLRQLFFFYLLSVAGAIFGWTISRIFFSLQKSKRFPGQFREIPARIADVIQYFFLQRSVAREGASWHHLPIFWGFLVLTVGSTELFINGLWPAFSLKMIWGETIDVGFRWVLDSMNFLVLIALLYAFYRRIVVKPRLIPMSADAGVVLGLITLLCVSHFMMHGFYTAANSEAHSSLPISGLVGQFAWRFDPATAYSIAEVNYWIHIGVLLFFLNYIPYSKHIHLLGSLPNIFLRNRDQKGVMPKLNLEDENDWGVGRFEQFNWKSLLDSYACTECARCSNNCPAYNTDKPLSPMHLILDIRHEIDDRDIGLPLPPMVGGRILDETLWACTTCGACEEVCPVFIEHPMKIMQMRTHLVLTESRMPAETARMFRGIETNQNPWNISGEKRLDWAEGLNVPTLAEKGSAEYLVWIGCAGAFDDRARKISRAWIELLQLANIDFAVLGKEEACTGDCARRAGNEFLFQQMAEANVATLNGYGVKKIITSCPHCMHSLKNEYGQFGGNYEVTHHSQFLAELVAEGKLKAKTDPKSGAVTFHDPCYLGRWNREFGAPREVVSAAMAVEPVEMDRHKEKSFCCGAGGARMWMEEGTPRVNVVRTEEALATGAKTIATACPFCNVMMGDGVKAKNKDEEVEVLDIAQLLRRSVEEKSSSSSAGTAS